MRDFLEDNVTEETRVFIGDEIGLEEMQRCSLVFSPLQCENDTRAFLGVIGPMRMDYSKVVSKLNSLRSFLEDEFLKEMR